MAFKQKDFSPKAMGVVHHDYSSFRPPLRENHEIFRSDVPDFSIVSEATSEYGNSLNCNTLDKSVSSENPVSQNYQHETLPSDDSNVIIEPEDYTKKLYQLNRHHIPTAFNQQIESDISTQHGVEFMHNNNISNKNGHLNVYGQSQTTKFISNSRIPVQNKCDSEKNKSKVINHQMISSHISPQPNNVNSSKLDCTTRGCSCNLSDHLTNFQTMRNKNLILNDSTNTQLPSYPKKYDSDKVFPPSNYWTSNRAESAETECFSNHSHAQSENLPLPQNQFSKHLQYSRPYKAIQVIGKENRGVVSNERHCCSNVQSSENAEQELSELKQCSLLREHCDMILLLQNQIEHLVKRFDDLESVVQSTCSKIDLTSNRHFEHSLDSNKTVSTVDKDCQTDERDIQFEHAQTKKTSTSTMTSLVLEENDKFGNRKQYTVVTRRREDVSVHCPKNRESPATSTKTKNTPIDSETPKIKPYLSKHDRKSAPRSSDSKKQKKRSPKLQKDPSKKENHKCIDENQAINGNDCNVNLQAISPQLRIKDTKNCNSPTDHHEENHLEVNFASPVFEDILRNINQQVVEEDDDDERNPESLREGNHRGNSKEKDKYCTPASPTRRKLDYCQSSSSSSLSSDSSYVSPQHKNDKTACAHLNNRGTCPGSCKISMYGISSPQLSIGTERYLQRYNLLLAHNSPNNEIDGRRSSKKTKTPTCRRQMY